MTTQYQLPVHLIDDIKEALIKLGYANNQTSDGFIQDAYFKYMLIRQTGQNPLMPYAFDLLPPEIRDQLNGGEPEEPGTGFRILPRSLMTMPIYEEVKPVTGQIVFLSYDGYRDVKRVEYVNLGIVPPEQVDALLDALPIRTAKPQVDYEAIVDFDSTNKINIINFGSSAPFNSAYQDKRVTSEVYISYDIFAPYKDQYDAWGNPEGRDMETIFVDQKGRIIGKLPLVNVFDETDPQVGFGHSSATFDLPIDTDVLEVKFFIGASILNNTAYFTPTGQTPVFKIRATHPAVSTTPEIPEEPIEGGLDLPMELQDMSYVPMSTFQPGQVQFLNAVSYVAFMSEWYSMLGMSQVEIDQTFGNIDFENDVPSMLYNPIIDFVDGVNIIEFDATSPLATNGYAGSELTYGPAIETQIVFPRSVFDTYMTAFISYSNGGNSDAEVSIVDDQQNVLGKMNLSSSYEVGELGGVVGTVFLPATVAGEVINVSVMLEQALIDTYGPFSGTSPVFKFKAIHPLASA